MDGVYGGKPYEQIHDLGGSFPPIFGSTPSISRPEIRQEMEGLQRIAAEKVEALTIEVCWGER